LAKLNLLVYLNSYSDERSTNDPSHNGIKWTRDLNAIPVVDPGQTMPFTLAPGESKTLFDTTRTLNQDNTTQYNLALSGTNPNTYILTAVGGTLPNFRTPRTTGADATTAVTVTLNGPVATFTAPANASVAAFFSGQVAGMTSAVTITANTAGSVGNSVLLTYDGVTNINTEITNWNTANPSNQVTLTSGDGTQTPINGTLMAFSGGEDASTAFNLAGVQVGDFVRVGNLFNSNNQGEWKIIAVSATSFSIANPIAVAEGPIVLGVNFATQIQIYGAAGVQVNDTLVISSGFSQVTWGSYNITGVAANWLQFYTTSILPQEGPITTEVAIYESAKKLVYLEADQTCAITINGQPVGSVEPWIIYNTTKPGQYMLKSTIYSMAVMNSSTNGAHLLMASIE
jgi:hypothetical protein